MMNYLWSNNANLNTMFSSFAPWLYLLIVWELVWKGIALWRAGRLNQPIWFIAILIFNTIGILPIIYLLVSQKQWQAGEKKD